MVILGVDPGLATLGYGVIEKNEQGAFRLLDYGVVLTPKDEGLPVRLAMLEEGLSKVLQKYHPDEVAMEELFFSKNITTGIAVAHARGVALLTCVKECGKLYEYTPMQVKQALTGYGKAEKKQIQTMVASMLHLEEIPKPDDAADAIAIALCHGFTGRFGNMYAVGNMTRAKGQNVAPASAYQALMQEGAKKSKKATKKTTKTTKTTKSTAAKTVKPTAPQKTRPTQSTVEALAASVIKDMKD
jgi:crossover junction endodeoxyribonuclease RuvC